MATIRFHVDTELPPAAVLAAITDFSSTRSAIWPNVDDAHFKVHDMGPGWADVTEGSSVAGGVWERERYTWDAGARTVAVETTESNTWGPGSRWDYRLLASAGGTRVEVTVVRAPSNLKARLIAIGLTLIGPAMLRSQMQQALGRMAARNARG